MKFVPSLMTVAALCLLPIDGLAFRDDTSEHSSNPRSKGSPGGSSEDTGEQEFHRISGLLSKMSASAREQELYAIEFPSEVTTLTKANYEITKKGTWVVDFYAPWCPHCRDFAPVFGAMATRLKSARGQLSFASVDCVHEEKLCGAKKIKGYPTTRMYHNGKIAHEEEGEKKLTEFGAKLKHALDRNGLSAVGSLIGSSTDTLPPQRAKHVRWPHSQLGDVRHRDLAVAVHFTLANGVFLSSQPLGTLRLDAMRRWLSCLEAALPASGGHAFSSLSAVLHGKTAVSRRDFDKAASAVKVFGLGRDSHSVGCKGSAHGATCTLWLLFHTLLQHSATDQQAVLTMHAIRAYAVNFFECESCREHFSKATHELGRLHTRRDAAMFLWRVHNSVTQRLAVPHGYVGDVFFPPASVCPACRKAGKYPDVEWDADAVFGYLSKVYCPGDGCAGQDQRPQLGKAVT